MVKAYDSLVPKLGSEIAILTEIPLEDISRSGQPLLAEAISRLRRGDVIREAGFDGEFGVIRLFGEGEIKGRRPLDYTGKK